MLRFVAGRVATVAPLLVLLTLIVFAMVQLMPGDPAARIAGPDASPQFVEHVRAQLGLNHSVWSQYLHYIEDLLHGDLGFSFYTDEPVTSLIARTLPRTASIAFMAMVIAVLLSIPMGVVAALRRNTWIDRALTSTAVVLLALPPFVLAAILIKWFSLGGVRWFPPGGYVPFDEDFGEWFTYAILPAITIATVSLAELARLARGSLIDVLEEDYIRTARAKGLSKLSLIGKHAAKNAAVPYVTILGLQIGRVIGAAVVVEAVFNIQGFGQLGVDAVLQRDIPTIQGIVLVSGLLVLLTNLFVDISYGYFNPRTRAS